MQQNGAVVLARCLRDLLRRYRLLASLRGVTVITLAAVLISVALARSLASLAPGPTMLFACRLILAAGLASALFFGLWIPLRRSGIGDIVDRLERRWPLFEQRLRTFTSLTARGIANPFLPLLAEETLALAPQETQSWFIPRRALMFFGGAPVVLIALFLALLSRPGGQVSWWAQALWGMRSPFSVEVSADPSPVARGRDFGVAARATGFSPERAELWVLPAGSSRWQRVPMRLDGVGVLRGEIEKISADAAYVVSADGVRSPISYVRTVDVPLVRSVEVTMRGRGAHVAIETDRPMKGGELDGAGRARPLPDTANNRAEVALDAGSSGNYHVNVRRGTDSVRVSDDFEVNVFERSAGPAAIEIAPGARAPAPERIPAGYEKAVREYYRRINSHRTVGTLR